MIEYNNTQEKKINLDEKTFCRNNKYVLTLYLCRDLETLCIKRCCYHGPVKFYHINDVPSLKEIINIAEKPESIKKDTNAKNLPKICENCNSLGKIKQIRFDISHACNLNCYHCCEGDQHKDTLESKKLYFRLLKESVDLCENIQFTAAGEPFIYYEEVIDFLNSLAGHKVKNCGFVTNLSLLNIQRIDKLKQISEKTHIDYSFLVSIDGFDKASFERTRCGANYDIFLENLKYLSKTFNKIIIGFTNKKINDDQMAHIEDFCKMFGIRDYIIHYDSTEE